MSRRTFALAIVCAPAIAACTLFWPIEDFALRTDDAGAGLGNDAALDGATNADAADGGTSFAVEMLATVDPSPRLLAMNATHVFVVGQTETVQRVGRDSRVVETLSTPKTGVNGQPLTMRDLGADSQSLYLVANEPGGCGAPATAWKAPTFDGGTFAGVIGAQCGNMTALANDPLDFSFVVEANGTSTLISHPLLGGGNVILSLALPKVVAATSRPEDVYLASSADKKIVRVPKSAVAADGGADFTLTTSAPRDLVADVEFVYWIEVDGRVAKKSRVAPLAEPAIVLATEPTGLTQLAQDGVRLYFTNVVEGTVRAVAKAGGAVELVAGAQAEPLAIAADDRGVYWVNRGSGAVMRAVRQ